MDLNGDSQDDLEVTLNNIIGGRADITIRNLEPIKSEEMSKIESKQEAYLKDLTKSTLGT